jgi:hypothetical protein
VKNVNRPKRMVIVIAVIVVAAATFASIAVYGALNNQENIQANQNVPKYDDHGLKMPGLNQPPTDLSQTNDPDGPQR